MTFPKRHHFLPEFYQHGFTRDGYLCLYDRDEKKYRRDQPKNTAVIGHYYTYEDDEGNRRPEIEQYFANVVEAVAKPIIEKLDRREAITVEEKESFAAFIAFLHTRVPRFERMVNEVVDGGVKTINRFVFSSPRDVQLMLDEGPGMTVEQREMRANALHRFVQGEQYSVKATAEFRLEMMLKNGATLLSYFRQMNWIVSHAPKESGFLTTDAPVTVIPPADWKPGGRFGYGFLTPGAKTVVPLSRQSCLVMSAEPGPIIAAHHDLPKFEVRRFNKFIVSNLERFVIGRDEAHVRSLVSKMHVGEMPKEPLVEVGSGRRTADRRGPQYRRP